MKNKKDFLNDIGLCFYDWLCYCALDDKQADEWADLHRRFFNEDRQKLKGYLKNKSLGLSIEGGISTVKVGRYINLELKEIK